MPGRRRKDAPGAPARGWNDAGGESALRHRRMPVSLHRGRPISVSLIDPGTGARGCLGCWVPSGDLEGRCEGGGAVGSEVDVEFGAVEDPALGCSVPVAAVVWSD